MSSQNGIADPSVFPYDDVVSHEPPPSFLKLQPPPTLSDEQWQALGRTVGPVHFVYDKNGFPYLSLLTESGTMSDSVERLQALLEPSACPESV
ncbi:MAG: hypothetical protein Q8T09_00975 [Candidatus Melainabacteria bacterium]|nr:hypothetical protein [Candidatus Melainabacteria bacterium]